MADDLIFLDFFFFFLSLIFVLSSELGQCENESEGEEDDVSVFTILPLG